MKKKTHFHKLVFSMISFARLHSKSCIYFQSIIDSAFYNIVCKLTQATVG